MYIMMCNVVLSLQYLENQLVENVCSVTILKAFLLWLYACKNDDGNAITTENPLETKTIQLWYYNTVHFAVITLEKPLYNYVITSYNYWSAVKGNTPTHSPYFTAIKNIMFSVIT